MGRVERWETLIVEERKPFPFMSRIHLVNKKPHSKASKREREKRRTIISQTPGSNLGARGDISRSLALLASPPALVSRDGGLVSGTDTVLGLREDRDFGHVDQLEPGLDLGVLDKGRAVEGGPCAGSDGLVDGAAGCGGGTLLEHVGPVSGGGREGEDEGGCEGCDFDHCD